jgi:hypothetical protein
MKTSLLSLAILAGLVSASVSFGADGALPRGEPQLERPTLHSLGIWWIVQGDGNRNASVRLEYRQANAADWRAGAPLVRVERGAHVMEKYGSQLTAGCSPAVYCSWNRGQTTSSS